jgi:hypothetical protein
MRKYPHVLVRIKRRSKRDRNGCFVWQGNVDSGGYGQIWEAGSNRVLHKVVWQLFFGPILKGYQLHHTCENKRCWNPDHLKLVTPSQHKLLHNGNYCRNGHEYTEENTFIRSDGARQCRICRTAYLDIYHRTSEKYRAYHAAYSKEYEKHRIRSRRKKVLHDVTRKE